MGGFGFNDCFWWCVCFGWVCWFLFGVGLCLLGWVVFVYLVSLRCLWVLVIEGLGVWIIVSLLFYGYLIVYLL